MNDETFPDEIFRGIIKDQLDKDGDGLLSEDELAGEIKLNLFNKGIYSLKGIEYLQNLVYLNCGKNYLTELNLTNNV